MPGNLMLWWSFAGSDLETELPYAIERFKERLGKEPSILRIRDGTKAPEGCKLEVKQDDLVLAKEFLLE